MKLYHFTAIHHLPHIMREGLSKGDIPTWDFYEEGINGVWLTTDPNPEEHGLSNGEVLQLTHEQRQLAARLFGRSLATVPLTTRTLDKRAVRIEVVVPSTERSLFKWTKWAKRRCGPEVIEGLVATGGGKAKADT